MRPDDDIRRRRFVRYLGELIQLRLAVEHNLGDFEAAEQIVYLVDANVVHLFLSPYSRWNQVSPFRQILDQKKEEIGVATAVITAEYIFSRRLAGQTGYPVFLAPEHTEEIVEYFRRVDKEHQSGQREGDGDGDGTNEAYSAEERQAAARLAEEEIFKSLDVIRQALADKSGDVARLRQLFGDRIPRIIKLLDRQRLVRQPFFLRQQFARLLRDDLVRPLHLAPHIDRRRLQNFPEGEIEEWRSLLEAFAHYDDPDPSSAATGQQERALPRDRILNRDATVLTQLFALNEDLIARNVPVKVVLITEDQKIHYAVAYRGLHKKFNGETFLRRPIQFSPALNVEEMPNVVNASNSTLEIKSVIDSILGLKRGVTRDLLHQVIYQLAVELKNELQPRADPGMPEWKSALRRAWQKTVEDAFHIKVAPHIEVGLGEVKKAWEHVSNNAIGLNLQLLASRFRQEIGPLAEQISELRSRKGATDLADAFEAYQADQLEVLERRHLEWCLEWLLADPVRRGPDYVQRGPLLLRTDQLGVAANVDLAKSVDEIMRCEPDPPGNFARPLARILGRHDFPDLVMIAAVVAYRYGAWTQARDFGQRALDRLYRRSASAEENHNTQHNIREIKYLVAVCLRFELSELVSEQHHGERARDALRRKYEAAETAHKLAIEEAESRFDVFAQIRAAAERGTLSLAVIAIARLHPELQLLKSNASAVRRLAVRATEDLRRASSDLDTHFLEKTNDPDSPYAVLYFKANMNLISAFAFCSLEELYDNEVPRHLIQSALAIVRQKMAAADGGRRLPPHLSIECDICEWMQREESLDKRRRAQEIIASCTKLIDAPEAQGLTRLDCEILQCYRDHLTKRERSAAVRAKARV